MPRVSFFLKTAQQRTTVTLHMLCGWRVSSEPGRSSTHDACMTPSDIACFSEPHALARTIDIRATTAASHARPPTTSAHSRTHQSDNRDLSCPFPPPPSSHNATSEVRRNYVEKPRIADRRRVCSAHPQSEHQDAPQWEKKNRHPRCATGLRRCGRDPSGRVHDERRPDAAPALFNGDPRASPGGV